MALVLLATGAVATAQTVTVTTAADLIDINWQTATIHDLPGPDGLVSFSEAMIATNNTPGHQTIAFAIPGPAVLTSVTGYFFRASDEVTIDGKTQTAFWGNRVSIYGKELYLNADHCTLIGFENTAVSVTGSGGLVEGNTGSMNITVFGGSGSLIRKNAGGTIKIDRSNDNVVVGNTVQRVRVLGFGSRQPATNNRIGGPSAAERNYITGYGTWNSEGLPAGAAVQLAWTRGTLIENNWIGTTIDGLAQGNLACTMGISLETENHAVTVRDNLIAGILGQGRPPHHAGQLFGWAIYFWGSTTNIQIVGNTIGLDAHGAPVLGSVWGVNVDNFASYTVDGVSFIDNVIAGHLYNGLRVGPTATMRLSGNLIRDNGRLGIDLIPSNFSSGVSPNDPLDADTGGNGVQNFPVIATAERQGAAVRVAGTLHSSPQDDFTLEFFASPACDPSGYGQGQEYLGSASVSTDGAGNADFDVLLGASAAPGWVLTATATLEPLGATSEFSACAAVTGGLAGDLNCDGNVDFADINPFVLALTNPAGYQAAFPNCDIMNADITGDGRVDFGDINPFVALLTGA